MSLKAELEIWAAALRSYDAEQFEEAIVQFNQIADTSKICWNVGIVLATLGRHEEAIQQFTEAVSMDGFLTVAYHQKGVSNFMLGRYDAALKDFEDAFLYLRGNQTINYEQLGLDFRLYAAEVLFNCGLVKIYLGQVQSGMQDLREAQTQKQAPDHSVIDDAIRDQGRDYNVFSVPVGVLFRPAQAKLKNMATRDYMGKAILVAASDVNEAYTTFTGITRLNRGQTPTGAKLDPTHPALSRSASVNAIPIRDQVHLPIVSRMGRSSSDASIPSRNNTIQSISRPNGLSRINTVLPTEQRSMTASPRPIEKDLPGTDTPPWLSKRSPQTPPKPLMSRNINSPRPDSGTDTPLIRTPEETKLNGKNSLRITELYDDYYKSPDAYDDEIPDLPPIGGAKSRPPPTTSPLMRNGNPAVESWAKKTPLGRNPNAGGGLGRSPSARAPPSSFNLSNGAPNGGGATKLRRWGSRAGSVMSASRYDDDGSDTGSVGDMMKIRVKVHIGKLTRGMSVVPEDTYDDFVSALSTKFPELGGSMVVRFKDEDGDEMVMQDDGDYEAAVDVARVHAKGRAEGKLEVWID